MTRAMIEKNYIVEYAHRLPGHEKGCKYIHGHSGGIKVIFDGPIDSKTGMVIDFGHFGWLEKIIDEFDHALVLQTTDSLTEYLLAGAEDNKIPPICLVTMAGSPTAENICKDLMDRINRNLSFRKLMTDYNIYVYSVSFEETKGNIVTIERKN